MKLMKILIAGSHGMIGSAVTEHLMECGYQVVRLVRHAPGPEEVWWDPDAGKIEAEDLEGFDGVIHLATMPWPMRWTAKAKQKIRSNRLTTNRLLAESLAGCVRKPGVLICASGMGYYPSSGEDILTEDSPAGTASSLRCRRRARQPQLPPATRASGWCICASRRFWVALPCSG